jgi:hypothetical protein
MAENRKQESKEEMPLPFEVLQCAGKLAYTVLRGLGMATVPGYPTGRLC